MAGTFPVFDDVGSAGRRGKNRTHRKLYNHEVMAPILDFDAVGSTTSSSVSALRRERDIFQEDWYLSKELPG
jgi:hypothetical protein